MKPLQSIENIRLDKLPSKKQYSIAKKGEVVSVWVDENNQHEVSTMSVENVKSKTITSKQESIRVLCRVKPVLLEDINKDVADSLVQNFGQESTSSVERLQDILQSTENQSVFEKIGSAVQVYNKGSSSNGSQKLNTIKVSGKRKNVECKYDRVLPGKTSQEQVFEVVADAVDGVLEGINATIFAYGQTGSGKTYTMLGKKLETILSTGKFDAKLLRDDESVGVIPRSLIRLFKGLKKNPAAATTPAKDMSVVEPFAVHCSYMQIYNDRLYDLLADPHRVNPLQIRDTFGINDLHNAIDGKTGENEIDNISTIYVSGLSQIRVSSTKDVLRLLARGGRNRAVRATEYNESSSRSHAVLQLSVEMQDGSMRRAKLNLVDLAGSEKWNTRNKMAKGHARELTTINKSLSALGNCVSALSALSRTRSSDGRTKHVPYRDSQLTRLLQDSLGGNTRTTIIACVSPLNLNAQETISTLKFADRAKQVMVHVRVNEVVDDKTLLLQALAEVKRLKAQIRQMESSRGIEDGPTASNKNTKKNNNDHKITAQGLDIDGDDDRWKIVTMEEELRILRKEIERSQRSSKQLNAKVKELTKRQLEAIEIAEEAQQGEAYAYSAVEKALKVLENPTAPLDQNEKADPITQHLRSIFDSYKKSSQVKELNGAARAIPGATKTTRKRSGKKKKIPSYQRNIGNKKKKKIAWREKQQQGKTDPKANSDKNGEKKIVLTNANTLQNSAGAPLSGNIATALMKKKKKRRRKKMGSSKSQQLAKDAEILERQEAEVNAELADLQSNYTDMQNERKELELMLLQIQLEARLQEQEEGFDESETETKAETSKVSSDIPADTNITDLPPEEEADIIDQNQSKPSSEKKRAQVSSSADVVSNKEELCLPVDIKEEHEEEVEEQQVQEDDVEAEEEEETKRASGEISSEMGTADYMAKKLAKMKGSQGLGMGLKQWNRMALRHSYDGNDDPEDDSEDNDSVDPIAKRDGAGVRSKGKKDTAHASSSSSSEQNIQKEETDEDDIGQSLRIWSSRFNKWRYGIVQAYDSKRDMHAIKYQNGEIVWHFMAKKDYDMVDSSGNPLLSDEEDEGDDVADKKGSAVDPNNAGGSLSDDEYDEEEDEAPIKEDIGLRLKSLHKIRYEGSGKLRWHRMDEKKYEILGDVNEDGDNEVDDEEGDGDDEFF
eukprot:g2356.t1